jgi:uncharacterized phage-associated protein
MYNIPLAKGHLMTSITDVAKYLVESFPKYFVKDNGDLETTKLQKVSYYCQGWHLAWTDEALFKEDFQAWKFGPVQKELFELLKDGGRKPSALSHSSGTLSDSEKESVNVVVETYGKLTKEKLVELVHNETPWLNTRKGLDPLDGSDKVIAKSNIGDYFKEMLSSDGKK